MCLHNRSKASTPYQVRVPEIAGEQDTERKDHGRRVSVCLSVRELKHQQLELKGWGLVRMTAIVWTFESTITQKIPNWNARGIIRLNQCGPQRLGDCSEKIESKETEKTEESQEPCLFDLDNCCLF